LDIIFLDAGISRYEIVLTTITGTILFIMLISFCVAFLITYQKRKKDYQREKQLMQSQFKQELLQSQLETQEHSFNQISLELHDNIGQLLSSTKLLLGIATMEMQTLPDTLKTAEQTLAKAIVDLRALSKSLNSEWLHRFNLVENLAAEKDRINAARNIEVQLISEHEKLPLEPGAQVMLFRVVQEALQNSIKHSFANHIIIQIKQISNYFELCIKDDGSGFDIESAKKESLGLRNMEYRTQLLGGTIEWKPNRERGTLIVIKLPIKEP
jgi:signal transduction histidine kinase